MPFGMNVENALTVPLSTLVASLSRSIDLASASRTFSLSNGASLVLYVIQNVVSLPYSLACLLSTGSFLIWGTFWVDAVYTSRSPVRYLAYAVLLSLMKKYVSFWTLGAPPQYWGLGTSVTWSLGTISETLYMPLPMIVLASFAHASALVLSVDGNA